MKLSVLSSILFCSSSLVCVGLISFAGPSHRLVASPPIQSLAESSTIAEDSKGSSEIDGVKVLRSSFLSDAPEDIEGLTKRADLIVVVKIKQNLWESKPYTVRDSDGGIAAYATFTQADVRKVIKGSQNFKGKVISIAQEMLVDTDKFGKPVVRAAEMVEPMVKGGRYIIFLEKTLGVDGYAPIGFWAKHNTDGSDKSEDGVKNAKYQALRRQVRQQIKDDQP
jgi:hypothetical protein